MSEGYVYQPWARNLTKPKREGQTPSTGGDKILPNSKPFRGGSTHFSSEAEDVLVTPLPKGHRGDHDS